MLSVYSKDLLCYTLPRQIFCIFKARSDVLRGTQGTIYHYQQLCYTITRCTNIEPDKSVTSLCFAHACMCVTYHGCTCIGGWVRHQHQLSVSILSRLICAALIVWRKLGGMTPAETLRSVYMRLPSLPRLESQEKPTWSALTGLIIILLWATNFSAFLANLLFASIPAV
jgi:hypothetical protein